MALPRALGRFNKVATQQGPRAPRRARALRRARARGSSFRTGLPRAAHGLPFGCDRHVRADLRPKVDWLRNARAACGCRLRIGREILTLGPPVDLTSEVGLARMPAPARVVLRLGGVDRFVELPVLHGTSEPA